MTYGGSLFRRLLRRRARVVVIGAFCVALAGCAGSKQADGVHTSQAKYSYVKTKNLGDLIALELNHYDSPHAPNDNNGRHKKKRPSDGSARTEFDIPFTMNAKVEEWVRIFSTTLRERFGAWLERSGRYTSYMEHVLESYHMPKDLIYLSMIESGLNPNAYSHANAAGLWQFIRGTGRMYGLDAGPWVDERFDIIKATHAAARHLKDLYARYDDWYLAFAAYNAGPGKVDRAIRSTGSKNFWTISRTNTIRKETKDYVPRILAAAYISKNPHKFGFNNLNHLPALEFETVRVEGGLDLETASRCAGTDLDWMKTMNGELARGITPPGQLYPLRVPMESSARFEKAYAELQPEEKARFAYNYGRTQKGNAKERAFASASSRPLYHKVKRRETLGLIASRYGVSSQELKRANKLKGTQVRIGQTLKIPRDADTQLYAANKAPKHDEKIREALVIAPTQQATPEAEAPQTLTTASLVPASVSPKSSAAGTKTIYKVRPGDTVFKIATREKVSMSDIKTWNPSLFKKVLYAGQKIVLYKQEAVPRAEEMAAETAPAASKPAHIYYKVKKGDTLWDIAKVHSASVTAIKQLNVNKIGRRNELKIGMVLAIPNSNS